MGENKKNLLVTLADKNYILQAKQLFSSVYWNAGWEGDYMLLSHEIPEEDLKWFKEKEILIRVCAPLFGRKTGELNYPPVIFDKFYLFTPEFKKWKTIIFLDADIIVKESLNWLTKIKNFGAIQDIYFRKLGMQFSDPKNNEYHNKTYNMNVPAFNSGVFCFSTDIITTQLFSELNDIVKKHITEVLYPEQAALNLIFYEKWKKLPWIYNTYIALHQYKLPKKIKAINLHLFAMQKNPSWNPDNSLYKEWNLNLERAELMDLNKIQKSKNWGICKIKFYSIVFIIYVYIFVAPYRLKQIFFIYDIQSFFEYRLKSFFVEIVGIPNRLIGKSGAIMKKYYPNLYKKLKK